MIWADKKWSLKYKYHYKQCSCWGAVLMKDTAWSIMHRYQLVSQDPQSSHSLYKLTLTSDHRESWSVLTPERLWSATEVLCLPWKREATWRLVPGPPKLLQSTLKLVRTFFTIQFSLASAGAPCQQAFLACIRISGDMDLPYYLMRQSLCLMVFSATAAQGVPEGRL